MKTRAAVLHTLDKQAPFAQSQPLKIEEIDLDAPGLGEVLIKLTAAGLCHSDLSVITGVRPRYPWRSGMKRRVPWWRSA